MIAHRGASGTAPENTLAAFGRAEALGAHMIELDVQLSADGEVIVLHDDAVDRTTDGRGSARSHTLAELRRLDAGSWFSPAHAGERVPTLADVLQCVDIPVNVELKAGGGPALEARALEVVQAQNALSRVVFSSFDHDSLARLRGRSSAAEIAVLWADRGTQRPFFVAARVAATALHLRKNRVTEWVVSEADRAGLEVRVWTINDPEEWVIFEDWGARAVFTDYPERFLQISSS